MSRTNSNTNELDAAARFRFVQTPECLSPTFAERERWVPCAYHTVNALMAAAKLLELVSHENPGSLSVRLRREMFRPRMYNYSN